MNGETTEDISLSESDTYILHGTYTIGQGVKAFFGAGGKVEQGTLVLSGNNTISVAAGNTLDFRSDLTSFNNSTIVGGTLGLYTFKNPARFYISSGNLNVSSDLDGWYFGGFRKDGLGTLTLNGDDNSDYYVGINAGTVRVASRASLAVGSLFGTPQGTLQIDNGGIAIVSVPSNFSGKVLGTGTLGMYGRLLAVEDGSYHISNVPTPS
ncbi:MAG: autotransporter-associated beta strand repeat-containing protein, partial [Verrucomicrobiota bacterium]